MFFMKVLFPFMNVPYLWLICVFVSFLIHRFEQSATGSRNYCGAEGGVAVPPHADEDGS